MSPSPSTGNITNWKTCTSRPVRYQQPAPPLWIGASTPPGARRAGRIADGFVAGPSTDLANTIELVETYRETAAYMKGGSRSWS